MLPAITSSGPLDLLVYEGHTDAGGFVAWLEQAVLPKMNPFPGPNSILVMDNASWHRDIRVPTLCARFGIMLIYLPPYSPDFNPIEAYFSDCKALIRRSYQYNGGDELASMEFRSFLRGCAESRGGCIAAIEGHYRHAQVPFREGAGPVDYLQEYAEQLGELERHLIVKGYVE